MILVNLPGFGKSPAAGSALSDYADAIATMFDDLALPPETDVLGNGLGGFVALSLASRYGARFARMVLVGSAIAFPEAGRATFRVLADKVEREGMGAVADAAMRRMFPEASSQPTSRLWPGARRCSGRSIRRCSPRRVGCWRRSISAAELARIRNPTLIVVGAADQATPPALGRALADRLANARLTELPRLGHCPHIQDPDAFVAAIAPFLGLRPQRPGNT